MIDTPGGPITVTVQWDPNHRERVRVGIDAPKDYPIWRGELLRQRAQVPNGESVAGTSHEPQ